MSVAVYNRLTQRNAASYLRHRRPYRRTTRNQNPFFEYHMNDFIERQKNPAPTIRELLAPLGKAGTKNNPNMKEAAETYRANHPGCNMVNDDINNVFDELSNYAGVDLVFGGPPCQGFSLS